MISTPSRLAAILAATLLALGACNAETAPGQQQANDTVLATVNGTPIKQSTIDAFMSQRAAQGLPDTPEMRKAILEELISREVVRQAAVKQGLDKRADVRLQLELLQQNVLLNAYVRDYMKSHPIGDDQIKNEYDKLKAQIGDKQYRVRHILVPEKKDAEAIVAQLKKGASFEKLAREKSKDSSAGQGGDLGWNVPAAYVKPFGEAITRLKKGEYTTTPVQTQFGWHVIKLEDVKDAPTLAEIKPQLVQRLQQQILQQMAAELKAKAKIEYTAAAQPPATPTPAAK